MPCTCVQVASWGGALLDRGILTMSLAPRDNHEAQVQFALERGIPAILGVISTQRLPFPAAAFDIAHCSRCLIPWTVDGNPPFFFVYYLTTNNCQFVYNSGLTPRKHARTYTKGGNLKWYGRSLLERQQAWKFETLE